MPNDTLGLAGKVALVTGASRGIGRSVVELFAELGASVAVNYVRDVEAANEAVAKAKTRGIKAVAIQGDVSTLEDGSRVVKETLEHFGRLDFLICNAGIWEGDAV